MLISTIIEDRYDFLSFRHSGKCFWSAIGGDCKVARGNAGHHTDVGQSSEQAGHRY